jgi:hypothetical protein
MSFDPVEVCGGDPWFEIGLVVSLWIVPIVLFVLRRQLPAGSRHSGLLTAALIVASAIATLASLPWLDVVDFNDPVYPVVTALIGWTSAITLAGIYVRRTLGRREAAKSGIR